MAQIDFRPAEVEPDTKTFDPVPAGDYVCHVIESDVKKTKAGDGTILKLTSEIVDGPHTGRRVFDNLNIENPSAEAQRISKQRLRALCDAIGAPEHVTDTEVLHFKHFIGRVTVKPAEGQWGPKNEIRYRPLPGATNVQPIRPPQQEYKPAAQAPPPVAPGNPPGQRPWVKPAR